MRRRKGQVPAPLVLARGRAGKMLVPLLGVLALIAMAVAGAATFILMQERDKRQAKERELQLALAENDDLKSRLDEAQQAKGELESKVLELSGQPLVELEKVRVANDQPGGGKAVAMPASASSGDASQGQVVVVNREYDFIVMNIGRNHGLSVGKEFQVIRGNEVLGKVKVEKVYDELSAAAILPESQKNNIREGDAVKAL